MEHPFSRYLSFGKSDTGRRRKNNEDAFVIKPDSSLCAVADGMGGAAAGEVASRMFVETALDVFSDAACQNDQQASELVRRTFGSANRAILKHVEENPQLTGMGCTAELLVLCGERYLIGHVGDSRTYLFRDGALKLLTRDHSLVQEQLDQGLITKEEASKHRFRNIILRAVGTNATLSVDLLKGKLRSGDIFLMCSDGLTNMVQNPLIQEILASSDSLARKVDELIKRANANGGLDNITVVLVQVS